MSIFFWEPRKKWVVQWTESGKKVRRYFGTEQEAKVFEEDRTDTQGESPQSLTLGELTLYYFRANTHKHERFKSMMASLLAGREEDGKHIDGAGEFLYDIHAEKLTRKDLERMRENMRVRGLKNNSINKYQAYIRAILAWGVDQDLIQFNPWRDYKRLPVQRHIVTTNINDIRVVYAHAPEWLQWAMKTMYCLSLRSGQVELFSLLWTAFDFRRGTVTVRQGKSGHIKRVYPPSAYLTEAAQRCAEDLKFGIPLVCHRQGKRVINYSKA